MTVRLVEVLLGDDGDTWRRAGFAVDGDGCFDVGGISFCTTGRGGGVLRWTLAVDDPAQRPDDVDGLPTAWTALDEPTSDRSRGGHANGATALDHLVVGSPNRARTIDAFGAQLGLDVRGTTEHRLHGRDMVQTFFLLEPTLIEVISRPEGDGDGGDGPCTFWGLAFTVDDLDATKARLRDNLGDPKPAVQEGRRIASLRGEVLGLSVPVAFLTPRS